MERGLGGGQDEKYVRFFKRREVNKLNPGRGCTGGIQDSKRVETDRRIYGATPAYGVRFNESKIASGWSI